MGAPLGLPPPLPCAPAHLRRIYGRQPGSRVEPRQLRGASAVAGTAEHRWLRGHGPRDVQNPTTLESPECPLLFPGLLNPASTIPLHKTPRLLRSKRQSEQRATSWASTSFPRGGKSASLGDLQSMAYDCHLAPLDKDDLPVLSYVQH